MHRFAISAHINSSGSPPIFTVSHTFFFYIARERRGITGLFDPLKMAEVRGLMFDV